tara:strand:- start:611 stop:913 length:303 start_codon:yes stop_codon:yes gene_type:complete
MNEPIKADNEFLETSSVIIRLKDLGVAVVLAAANADIIEPTVKVAMTSILDEMMFNNSIIDSIFKSGTNFCKSVLSATCAKRAPKIEIKQKITGLNQSFS